MRRDKGSHDTDGYLALRRAQLGFTEDESRRAIQVDELGREQLRENWRWTGREIAVLPRVLADEEDVLVLTYAHRGFAAGVLALTSRRLIFLSHRVLTSRLATVTVEVAAIERMRVYEGGRFGRMRIYLPDKRGRETWQEFHRMQPADSAERVAACLPRGRK